MKRHALVRSEAVDRDATSVVEYLLTEATADVALRFIDALEETYELLQSQPEIGRRYAPEDPRLADIRAWRVHRFERYLVFYRVLEEHVRVERVLSGSRDIWELLGFEE